MIISPYRPVHSHAPRTARASTRPLDRVELSGTAPSQTDSLARLASLSAGQVAAMMALPPPGQAAFLSLWQRLDGAPPLIDLLERGTLARDDLAEKLDGLSRQPCAPGLDPVELTEETVEALAEPDRAIGQGNRFTCSVTNLEHQLTEDPAEFVELVAGLASPEGQADIFERVPGSEKDDGSGRSSLDRLLQGALMAVGGMRHGTYLAEFDRFVESPEQRGLGSIDIALATALARDQDQAVVLHDETTRAFLEQEVASGQKFQVGVDWNGEDHMLLVKGFQQGHVVYYNPQKPGNYALPAEDFLSRLQFAVLGEDQLEGSELPDQSVVWIRPQELMGGPNPEG